MSVSGYNSKPHKEQIDILLYLLAAPERQEQALQASREYLNPRTNTIFEWYKFNSRVQLHGESVGEFVTALHTAESCD
ncbi:hypothetical protein PR048_009195 [Dryococelus australis]|uniref:Uncharacterized protein n=1 Tax=Dryococelus australis TaxID=614101 RepID=A0ABQ9HZ80_9NEOP|nr:hypothetical protein PR048_009195 [Dryococelus australis]